MTSWVSFYDISISFLYSISEMEFRIGIYKNGNIREGKLDVS